MSHSSHVRQAVHFTLAAALASAYATPAAAQETELEEVVVTGSRIARADYDAASPVITLDQDTFKMCGEAQLETVLNYMSEAAGFIVVLDTKVTGKIDAWSNQPLSKEEAVNLLNSALNRNGFVAIRNGRTLTSTVCR